MVIGVTKLIGKRCVLLCSGMERYEVLALNLISMLKLCGEIEGRVVTLWMGTGVVSMSNRRYNRRKESIGVRCWSEAREERRERTIV
ncbi:hypothetical protein [Paenibacillus sp. LPE1-1-1.1]|uniref:hypothetical protein n=1 Tax=Paenibacillus sp. LPE1-1-1.1 TaxID=3135230 RepID=UPI00342043F3